MQAFRSLGLLASLGLANPPHVKAGAEKQKPAERIMRAGNSGDTYPRILALIWSAINRHGRWVGL